MKAVLIYDCALIDDIENKEGKHGRNNKKGRKYRNGQ